MIISVSIKQEAYTNDEAGYCWLSNKDGLIWAFLGPVFVVLILNTIILTSSAIRIGTARKNLDKLSQMRVALTSAFILTPILGMPWVVSFARILTVGIQHEFISRILETFIDWVFICLNAPAGIIFFIIVFKRFKEHRKSIRVDTSRKTDQSTSDFARFRKNNVTTESSFAQSTFMAASNFRKIPSDASKTETDNMNGSGNLMTSSFPKPKPRSIQNNESLFDTNDTGDIYSTIDQNLLAETIQIKHTVKKSFSDPIYEVSSLKDLSKLSSRNEEGIELSNLENKLSASCQFNYDNPYEMSQLDDRVRLTQSDDGFLEPRESSIFIRGIDFIKSSFKLSNKGNHTDTEAGNDETTTDYKNNSTSKATNIYLEHLHHLAERSHSTAEISEEPTTESQTGYPLRIRRKSSPGKNRQSCEHAVQVKDLKDYFSASPKMRSPLSSDVNQYSKITESEEGSVFSEKQSQITEASQLITETTSPHGSSLKLSISPMSQLVDTEEKRIKEPIEPSNLHEDDVFNSPKKTATNLFHFQLASNESSRKKLTLQKSNSLGNIDQDDISDNSLQRRSTELYSASNVSNRVQYIEHIIERSMTDVDSKAPAIRKAHSVGGPQRVRVTIPSSDSKSDENSAKHDSGDVSPQSEK